MRKNLVLVATICTLLFTFVTGEVYGADLALGKKVFQRRCAFCHGQKGNGNGYADFVYKTNEKGKIWKLYPRDFTQGVFRFRSTATGSLPTDADLLRLIEVGIPRSSMPPTRDLDDAERRAVVEYIKSLSPRWKDEGQGTAIEVGQKPDWVGSPESVEKGAQVWKEMKCWECHGEKGRGDGTKSDELKDDQKRAILPFDFTIGALKRGTTDEDIYLAYTTGLDGSGMPSYEDSLDNEKRWHLVSFTKKLMGKIK
ncbi:c-type cytochrome [Candidatus Magnetobacterium casense]|uniref:C-type cytochrome n=1 Tax=Candidatus Magnetobacterium casense TaxID=1455061 RepID=A0ABS6RWL1_9BACT|nr:c-type cytochrome [Candidatus Magnetobacterium casensis]MBV6340419.1 c-type cytochrome [Candidatus Magnetobacterium casensis]